MIIPVIFYIIVFFIIFISITNHMNSTHSLLYKVFSVQQFSNISNIDSTPNLSIIRANNNGENYVFGVKKDSSLFNASDIEKIYRIAHTSHIHTIIIVTNNPITPTNSIYHKLKEYNIDVWDTQKLVSLASDISIPTDSNRPSVLKTSDVSDDTCEIDKNSFDPIQETDLKTHSLLSGLFEKPTRL